MNQASGILLLPKIGPPPKIELLPKIGLPPTKNPFPAIPERDLV
jgi:hypothetical protein